MNVKPMLDDWEIPRIQSIRALERRRLAELVVPGRVGSLFHDLDMAPTRICMEGSMHKSEEKDDFFESLRGKFRAGEPVTFVADITTATEIQHVLVETLAVWERADAPDELAYRLVLIESPPPPPAADPFGDIEAGLPDIGAELMGDLTAGLDVLDMLGDLPGLGTIPEVIDPTPPLSDAISGVSAAVGGLDAVTGPLFDIFGDDDPDEEDD